MTKEKTLALIRASIAAKQIPKRILSRRLKVSKPYFSQMLNGDVPLRPDIKDKLLNELDLKAVFERLEGVGNE